MPVIILNNPVIGERRAGTNSRRDLHGLCSDYFMYKDEAAGSWGGLTESSLALVLNDIRRKATVMAVVELQGVVSFETAACFTRFSVERKRSPLVVLEPPVERREEVFYVALQATGINTEGEEEQYYITTYLRDPYVGHKGPLGGVYL